MTTKRKARTLRLTETDQEAIARLKAYYGLAYDNEVIRLALHAALREIEKTGQTNQPPATRNS